jgi:hypothetical protein
MQKDLMRYFKFVAAPTEADAARAESHFQAAGMKTRRMAEVESLELAKLAGTTYFGACTAFAQEINRYANGSVPIIPRHRFQRSRFSVAPTLLSRLHRGALRNPQHPTAATNRSVSGTGSNTGIQ